MGCFVTCFGGVSNRKKRRKQPQRFLLRDIIHGSYEPLDSLVQEIPEPSPTSLMISSNNITAKIKKKVRFDLNVRTYEPILQDDLDEPDSNESCSNTGEETSRVDLSSSDWDPAFPPLSLNNRYQNCRDTDYEEEEEEDDEFVFADSDFDYESDEELDSSDDMDDYDDASTGEEDSLSSKSEEEAPLMAHSRNGQKTHSSSNEDARPKGRFAESVLNPVENLTQWKAIKAKEAAPPKCRFKENIALELKPQCSNKSVGKHEIKVNMSLSNWLPMSDTTGALTRQGMSC